jgi:dihydrofolate reductase
MRQVIVSSLISADSVVGDPQGWANRNFEADDVVASIEALKRSHAMLMGRRAYEYFAPVWGPADNPYAEQLRRLPKLVFTSAPLTGSWPNAEAAGSDPVGTVRRLKAEGEGDLMIYGFTRLAATLLTAGLVDRLELAVHPVLVGTGAGPFLAGQVGEMELVQTKVRRSGVVNLTYRCGPRPAPVVG